MVFRGRVGYLTDLGGKISRACDIHLVFESTEVVFLRKGSLRKGRQLRPSIKYGFVRWHRGGNIQLDTSVISYQISAQITDHTDHFRGSASSVCAASVCPSSHEGDPQDQNELNMFPQQ